MSAPGVEEYRARLGKFFVQLYPDAATAELDLGQAAATVDAVAAARYKLPLAASPLVLSWVLTLAEELAWSRAPSGKLPENVRDRAAAVRKQLEMLANRQLVLPEQQELEDSGIAGAFTVECSPPLFGRENMEGY